MRGRGGFRGGRAGHKGEDLPDQVSDNKKESNNAKKENK